MFLEGDGETGLSRDEAALAGNGTRASKMLHWFLFVEREKNNQISTKQLNFFSWLGYKNPTEEGEPLSHG